MADDLDRIFRRYGYDPRDPVRGHEIPDRLVKTLARAQLLSDREIIRTPTRLNSRDLSRRELQALEMIACGLQYKEIAAVTARSPQTVQSHLKSAYAKLHARNGIHAVVLAIAQGLIPSEGDAGS